MIRSRPLKSRKQSTTKRAAKRTSSILLLIRKDAGNSLSSPCRARKIKSSIVMLQMGGADSALVFLISQGGAALTSRKSNIIHSVRGKSHKDTPAENHSTLGVRTTMISPEAEAAMVRGVGRAIWPPLSKFRSTNLAARS